MTKTIAAEEVQWKDILDDVTTHHEEVVITKDGQAIARLVPEPSLRGPMYGRIQFLGDIVEPLDEDWDANR
ncbi:MAG TPA: type II toxin-antitoxin system prevent-host-death family antitoxin [Thermoanaerobaculia bacterium]